MSSLIASALLLTKNTIIKKFISFSTPPRPQSSYLIHMTSNSKGSGELHKKALSDWFSTEPMNNDFDWSICDMSKFVQSEFNPPYGKRWRLYILQQYLANLT